MLSTVRPTLRPNETSPLTEAKQHSTMALLMIVVVVVVMSGVRAAEYAICKFTHVRILYQPHTRKHHYRDRHRCWQWDTEDSIGA